MPMPPSICSGDLGLIFNAINYSLVGALDYAAPLERSLGTSPWRARQLLEVRKVCRWWRKAFDEDTSIRLPKVAPLSDVPEPETPLTTPWEFFWWLRVHFLERLIDLCQYNGDGTADDEQYVVLPALRSLVYDDIDIIDGLDSDGALATYDIVVIENAIDSLVRVLWLETRDRFRRIFRDIWLPTHNPDRPSWQTLMRKPAPLVEPRIDNPRRSERGRPDIYFTYCLIDDTGGMRTRFGIPGLLKSIESLPLIRNLGVTDRTSAEYWNIIGFELWNVLPQNVRTTIRLESRDWIIRGDPDEIWKSGPDHQ